MVNIFTHAIWCEQRYLRVSKGCPECGLKFKYKSLKAGSDGLRGHMKRMHSCFCELCQESFENRDEFKQHMTEKHKETYCISCLKNFSLEDLAEHNKELHFCEIYVKFDCI